MMTTAKLLLYCSDKPGILVKVTDFFTINKGNIVFLEQYVDHVEDLSLMGMEGKVLAYKNKIVILS